MGKTHVMIACVFGMVVGRWACSTSASDDRTLDIDRIQRTVDVLQERVRELEERKDDLPEPVGDLQLRLPTARRPGPPVVLKPGMLYDPDTGRVVMVPNDPPGRGLVLTEHTFH